MAGSTGRLPPAGWAQLRRATEQLLKGQYVQCLQICEGLLRKHPRSHEALTLCGQAHLKLGQIAQAAEALKRRFELDPLNAQLAEDAATLLMHERQFAQALDYLTQCVALRGWTQDLGHSMAVCHQHSGNPAMALTLFSEVIAKNPQATASYIAAAALLNDMRRFKEALELLDLALVVNPDGIDLIYCQAKLLDRQGLHASALEKFDRLDQLGDKQIEHWVDHADLLARTRRTELARKKFTQALEQDPTHRRAMTCYARLLFMVKEFDQALELFEKIAANHPDDAGVLVNMGNIYSGQRDFAMAKECFEKAYAINPTGPEIAGSYLYMMSFVSQWKDYKSVLATIESDQEFVTSRSFPSVVFENNPQANLAYARSHIKSKFAPTNILGDLKPHARKDKIRIGYYSSDFYHHATVMLIEGMLREHDRGRFELYAFSLDLTKPDHYNARIRELFDHYHDVSRLSDGAVTLLSRQLEIDIAIDLKGFTEGSRTAIFAERAAPVQINYLGFPGSMGAPYMDYMVADRYTVTPQTRAYFDEKIIYMPDCYQPNNPGRPSPGQGSLRPPELSESKFVFCSFNNTYKLTPTVFDLWLRILHQAPDSVLWMLKTTQQAEANLLAYIKDAGMDPSRIVFAPILTETEHLKRFAHADLFMDSFPCNAHTTASDALWAGVPLITRSGSTFASRVAGSILHAVGLEELIVDSEAAYEALALRIYKDRAYHRQLKQRVKDGVDNGALYDVVKYTRAFEQALIEVHERHRRGEAPQDLEAVSRLDKPTALLSAS